MDKTAESTKLTLVITDEEREIAKSVKVDFKDILKSLDKSVKSVSELKKAVIDDHPSQADLENKYRGKLIRYRRKVQETFNALLMLVQKALEKLAKISDPDMIRLREILAAEVGELSEGGEAILDILKETDREGFSQRLEQICAQLEKRQKSIKDVIENQLFGHIDKDLLGKMKLSRLHFNMKRRARIIKQLVKGK